MPWNNRHSPLDHTIGSLDEIVARIRQQVLRNEPPTEGEFLAVAIVLERLSQELKPLQDLQIQERNESK